MTTRTHIGNARPLSKAAAITMCVALPSMLVACGTPGRSGGVTETTAQSNAEPTPSATQPVVLGPNLDGRVLGDQDYIASDGTSAVVVTYAATDDPWHPQPFYEAYDVATGSLLHTRSSPGAVADGACGFGLVRAGDRSIILDMISAEQPAQGTIKARRAHSLRAIDAATTSVLWTVQVDEGTTDEVEPCNPAGYGLGTPGSVQATLSGRYALFGYNVIDLTNGQLKLIDNAVAVVGDWVVVEDSTHDLLALVDPDSGATAGTVSDWFGPDQTNYGGGVFVDRDKQTLDLAGYSLPSGAKAWQTDYDPTSRYIVYDKTTNAFVLSDLAYGADEVLAVSAADGQRLWGPIDTDQPCGVADGRLVVSVNGQLAVLDVATGNQLSYDATTGVCPTILGSSQLAGHGGSARLR